MDNESDDDTKQIAEQYADKVITVSFEYNLGYVRNKGIEIAESELIYNTDADVEWSKNVVESTKKAFEENENLNAVTHAVVALDDEPPFERFFFNIASKIRRGGWGCSMAFPKEVWKKYGRFENIGGSSLGQHLNPEDVDLWSRIPEPKLKLTDAVIKAEGSEWKEGLIPVVAVSSTVSATGAVMKKPSVVAVGAGALAGEAGHQLTDYDGDETGVGLHHDQLGVAGLAGTFLYDKVEGIDDKYKFPLYGFFGGLVLHHIATEGVTGVKHFHRRSVRDVDERTVGH